ncbi:MAG: pentapeptide repeat-containing protein [Prochloraceae cyanobacterium]|nr:pentapeptide repeat-containing protein [Prochloraceae cyanobacterium]
MNEFCRGYQQRLLQKKIKQAAKGRLSLEEVQHLKRCGVDINHKTNKRVIKKLAAWCQTTTIEKYLEDVVFLLKNAALLDIINLLAGITIIVSLTTWLANEKQRRNAEVYQAWQVITAAYEQSGSGGRKEALEFLNSETRRFPWFWLTWKKQSLVGLEAPKALLTQVNLQSAKLFSANLQSAILFKANLELANLTKANLQSAGLYEANLQSANLSQANLQSTRLIRANLESANLTKANLQSADLYDANLSRANLSGVKNLTPEQVTKARNWKKACFDPDFREKLGLPREQIKECK